MDKSKLIDTIGRPLTQGLFIEVKYDPKYAVYTLEENDKTYKGIVYPSLKRLYLESEDPTEYLFAKAHLLGWAHWERLKGNSLLRRHFDQWKEELEVSIRSTAIQDIISASAEDKGFQAAKWLADRGWDKRTPGRPTKEEAERHLAIEGKINDEFSNDFKRLNVDGPVAKRSSQ